MNHYLTQNAKMRRSSGPRTFAFGIPAYRSSSGFVTCPAAGECARACYARRNHYTFSVVKRAQETRLELTQSEDFVPVISREIERRRIESVRIHDSGDFYSPKYLNKWLAVMARHPDVRFYSYTKRVALMKRYREEGRLPANFTVIYSYGGTEDRLIERDNDRHSFIFKTQDEATAQGYCDASRDDAMATGSNHRVGLVFH